MEQNHIPFPYEFEEMTQEEKDENKRLYNSKMAPMKQNRRKLGARHYKNYTEVML